jgi:hypothetical protein
MFRITTLEIYEIKGSEIKKLRTEKWSPKKGEKKNGGSPVNTSVRGGNKITGRRGKISGGDIFDDITEEMDVVSKKSAKEIFPQINFDDEMGIVRMKIARYLGREPNTFAICDVRHFIPLDFEYAYVNKNSVYKIEMRKILPDLKFKKRFDVGIIKLNSFSDAILYDRLGVADDKLAIILGHSPLDPKYFPVQSSPEISESQMHWIDEQLNKLDNAVGKNHPVPKSYTNISVNHLNVEILVSVNIERIIWNLKQIFVGFQTSPEYPMIVYSDPIEYENLVRTHKDFSSIADYITSRQLSDRIKSKYEPQFLHVIMVTPEKIFINISFEQTGYAQLRTRFPYGTPFDKRTIQSILDSFVKFRDHIYKIPGAFSHEMEIFIDHRTPKVENIIINWLNVNISPNSDITLDNNRYHSAITFFTSLFGDFKIANGKIKEFIYMRTKNRSPANITIDGKIRFNNIVSRATLEAIKFRVDQIIHVVQNKSLKELETYIGHTRSNLGKRDMKVRILQSKDPVLFNYRKMSPDDKHEPYSKICQYDRQPHIHDTAEEAKKTMPKNSYVLEYDNKSFPGKKQFYTCPSKNYPYPGFKEGKNHPSGFCLPCCLKVSSIENKKSVNYINYHSCLHGTDAEHDTNNMNLKYVRNLHKVLQDSHLAHLPETLESYVNKGMAYKINQRHNLENGSDCYLVSGVRENSSLERVADVLNAKGISIYLITKTDGEQILIEKRSTRSSDTSWIAYTDQTGVGKGISLFYPVSRISIADNGKIERQYIFDSGEPIIRRLDKLISAMKKQNSSILEEKIRSGRVLDLNFELIEHILKYHLPKYNIKLIETGAPYIFAALCIGEKNHGILPVEGSITKRYPYISRPSNVPDLILRGLELIQKWTRANISKIYSDGFLINNRYFVSGKIASRTGEQLNHLRISVTPKSGAVDERKKFISKKLEDDSKYRNFVLALSNYINTKKGNPVWRREFLKATDDHQRIEVIRKHSPRPDIDRKLTKWFDKVTFEADKTLKYEIDKIRELNPLRKKLSEIVRGMIMNTSSRGMKVEYNTSLIDRAATDLLGNFIRRKEILDGDQISLTEHIRLSPEESLLRFSPAEKN